MESLLQYIPAHMILLLVALAVIGEMLKKYTTLPNQLLTTVLPILGAIIMGFIYLFDGTIFVASDFIQQLCIGIIVGWSATGGYEYIQNSFFKKPDTIKTIVKKLKVDVEEEEPYLEDEETEQNATEK